MPIIYQFRKIYTMNKKELLNLPPKLYYFNCENRNSQRRRNQKP